MLLLLSIVLPVVVWLVGLPVDAFMKKPGNEAALGAMKESDVDASLKNSLNTKTSEKKSLVLKYCANFCENPSDFKQKTLKVLVIK